MQRRLLQALLESGRVAETGLLAPTSHNVLLMKTALSFNHARKMSYPLAGSRNSTADVPESLLRFVVPLCAALSRDDALSKSRTTGPVTATQESLSDKEKLEDRMASDLIEMFEASLQAGLEGFIDYSDTELHSGGEDPGTVGADKEGGKVRVEILSPKARPPVTSREDNPHGDRINLPPWVDVAYHALVPGFEELVNQITRIYQGDTAAARTSNPSKYDIDNEEPKTGRRSNRGVSRRAVLKARRRTTATNLGQDDRGSGEVRADAPTTGGDHVESGSPPPLSVGAFDARFAISVLLRPLLSSGLVGYLGADACLFAWDQAIIGGFSAMLPRVAAMVAAAALTADETKAYSTFASVSDALAIRAPLIPVNRRHCTMFPRWSLLLERYMRAHEFGGC